MIKLCMDCGGNFMFDNECPYCLDRKLTQWEQGFGKDYVKCLKNWYPEKHIFVDRKGTLHVK